MPNECDGFVPDPFATCPMPARCVLGLSSDTGWLDRLLASFIPTTYEAPAAGPYCLQLLLCTCSSRPSTGLLVASLPMPAFTPASLLWSPLQVLHRPYIYSRLETRAPHRWGGPCQMVQVLAKASACRQPLPPPGLAGQAQQCVQHQARAKVGLKRIRQWGQYRPRSKSACRLSTNTSISAASFSSLVSPQETVMVCPRKLSEASRRTASVGTRASAASLLVMRLPTWPLGTRWPGGSTRMPASSHQW